MLPNKKMNLKKIERSSFNFFSNGSLVWIKTKDNSPTIATWRTICGDNDF